MRLGDNKVEKPIRMNGNVRSELSLMFRSGMAMTAQFHQSTTSGFTFDVCDRGLCTIQPKGRLLPAVSESVKQRVLAHIAQHGTPPGLLLDVRHNPRISIVRLSALIDELSQLNIPLAVLFGSETQRQLASLLHNTLANKAHVAYFTDWAEARAFLLSNPRRSAPGGHL